MKRFVFGAMLACLALPADANPSAGDWEIVLSNASGQVIRSSDVTVAAISVETAYFLTDRHQVGVGADWARFSSDTTSDSDFNFIVRYQYNWRDVQDDAWWYAGLRADDSVYTALVGRKWMLEDNVAFDASLGYNDPHQIDMAEEYYSLRFGLGIFF